MRRLLVFVCAAAVGASLAPGAVRGGGQGEITFAPYFISSCGVSHSNRDDPIVFAGRPGLSHHHTFVGNVSTDAFSTLSTLLAAGTTCVPKADTSAYWAPTLVVGKSQVMPIAALAYYKRLTKAPVRPYPPGLRMIAGSAAATAPQDAGVAAWHCGVRKTRFYTSARHAPATARSGAAAVPVCGANSDLQLHVNFPDCWSGKRLDSPDHASHMAYSVRGKCPASHPVAVPALSLVYRYGAVAAGNVALSSGSVYSAHADFVHAWKQPAFAKLVKSCLNYYRSCGAVS
jgi:hypothetical protein